MQKHSGSEKCSASPAGVSGHFIVESRFSQEPNRWKVRILGEITEFDHASPVLTVGLAHTGPVFVQGFQFPVPVAVALTLVTVALLDQHLEGSGQENENASKQRKNGEGLDGKQEIMMGVD